MELSAVQIIQKVDGKYVLDEKTLCHILQHNNVLKKKIAILGVAGAFRKGKSFLLSNFLRYLQCKRDGSDWMSPTALVTGFTWKQSADSVTEGILMWPEPFLLEDTNGEEIAVLLMDTEGAFDHKSSITQCATVFALAALMSSILVFNVVQDVQEDTLNHLQFFASYGRYALEEGDDESIFQSLLFLVRDWQNDNRFGMEAGMRHLKKIFKPHASSNSSMRTLRKEIQSIFDEITCALLPHPGTKITRGSEGDITVNDMDPQFKQELNELITKIFKNQIHAKQIGGKAITGEEFLTFIKAYVKLFANGKIPEPKSIYDASSEASHLSAQNIGLELYTTTMNTKFSGCQSIDESKLKELHQNASAAAVKKFSNTQKLGHLPEYLDTLKQKIEEKFKQDYERENQSRIKIEKIQKEKEEVEKKGLEDMEQAKEIQAEKEKYYQKMEQEKKETEEEAERVKAELKKEKDKNDKDRSSENADDSSLTNAGKFVGAVIGGVIQAVLHEHSGFSSIRRPPYINDLPFPSLINYDDDETDSNDPFDVEN